MARQESQSKLLYYPTPPGVVELIASWISGAEQFTRLADPCAGEGAALAQLARLLALPKVETWGVELSYARAEKAAQVLDTVLPASFYSVTWHERTVSLLFDNPPYDWSDYRDEKGRKVRHEVLFATRGTPKLVPGGLHILIVPQHLLQDESLARHWSGWYERSLLFRFPDGEFEAFSQVVLFGVRRVRYDPPTKLQIEGFRACGREDANLSPLEPGDRRFRLPPSPLSGKFMFSPIADEDFIRAAAQMKMLDSAEWGRKTFVRPIGAPIRPLVQEKIGHLSMEISSGDLGVVRLRLPDGEALAKGTLTKRVIRTEKAVEGEDGEHVSTDVEEREVMETVISLLYADGRRQLLSGIQDVADFITANAAPLADAVLARNMPLYGFSPTRAEWERAGKTALGLPPLPGRAERGLFEVQKHFAIASARAMAAGIKVILNCDMGAGKTAMAIAGLEQRDRWPALVLCPGHMVNKWRRDLELASDPDDPIRARIITRPARAEASWLHTRILPVVTENGGRLIGDERSQTVPVGDNDNGLRRRLTIRCEDARQRRMLAERLAAITTTKASKDSSAIKPSVQFTADGFVVECVDRDDYTLADLFADFDAGRLGRKAVAVCAFEPAKYDAGLLLTHPTPFRWMFTQSKAGKWSKRRVPACPGCGKPLVDAEGLPLDPLPDVCPHEEAITLKEGVGPDGQPLKAIRKCGTRLYEMSRWRRVGLSRLVQRKYKHRFKVYVADELHEAKSADTDIGTTDGRLLSSIGNAIALTGTLFGGVSSSLFYLLYRRSPEVRQLYGYKDVARWVDHFGLWKYRWRESPEGESAERGLSSGVKRWNVRPPDELAGVSPAVIRFLLPMTLFGKITDLGYTLPPLVDQVVTVAMTKTQKKQYEAANDELLDKAMNRLKQDKDPGLLTTWFTTLRYRPMSAFRPEEVTYQGESIMTLPPVVTVESPWLPKEMKLAEIVSANMARGRKTLVFVEQTGTRDIRGRLVRALNALVPQASVQTLSSGDMKPAKRELWIARHAPGMDVLLVNAGLVKTGLDLVMFNAIVFYETNTSLYTVWQSARRVWRLGQKREVEVSFLAYEGTVEAQLLDYMGEKMKHALLLYGDNAAGALVDSGGDDDFAREAVRRALEGKTYDSVGAVNGKSIFATGTEQVVSITTSPLSSPVAASPTLPIVVEVAELVQLDLFGGATAIVSVRKR